MELKLDVSPEIESLVANLKKLDTGMAALKYFCDHDSELDRILASRAEVELNATLDKVVEYLSTDDHLNSLPWPVILLIDQVFSRWGSGTSRRLLEK